MSAGLAVHGAIVAALKADAAVDALIDGRVYDRPPQPPTYPFVGIGEIQDVDDGADLLEGASEITVTLHVWSRAIGTPEAKRIAGKVRAALHRADLDLGDDYALVEILHRDTRVFLDGDGVTAHGVVTFRAMVDPAN